MRTASLLLLAAAALAAEAEPPALQSLLSAPERALREEGERSARRLAAADPAAASALFDGLDLRGRALLLRAMTRSGNGEAVRLALLRIADPEPELFRALAEGLAGGGEAALFTPLPEETPPLRRDAIERLRLRWRLEAELVKLKSRSGHTGSYLGQFDGVKSIGRKALPILLDIIADRQHPLAGEGGSGPYVAIHPQMVRFDSQELRALVGNNFHQVVTEEDAAAVDELFLLQRVYWSRDEETHPFERTDLAPALAYSLHDIGKNVFPDRDELALPAREWIESLRRQAYPRGWGGDPRAIWDLAYACIRLGRYDEGERYYREVLENVDADSRPLAAYNLACSFSMRAQNDPAEARRHREIAVRYLEFAVRSGFVDWPWIEQDRDLDAIRGEKGYRELLAALQREYPDPRRGDVKKEIDEILTGGK